MDRGLILLQAEIPFETMIHEIRSVDLVRDFESPLVEDLVEHATGDRLVSVLL